MIRRQQLLVLLTLPIIFSLVFLWWSFNQPSYGPSSSTNSVFSDHASSTETSLPADPESSLPPSTDFLNLAFQRRLRESTFDPYPKYNSRKWKSHWKGPFRLCKGPDGVKIDQKKSMSHVRLTTVSAPNPRPMFGSYKELAIDDGVCFDRYSRYAASGLTDDDTEGFANATLDWDRVEWGALQDHCVGENLQRFKPEDQCNTTTQLHMPASDKPTGEKPGNNTVLDAQNSKSFTSRKAVLVRAADSQKYSTEVVHHLRAMITELSLNTGGEYSVYLLVEALDPKKNVGIPDSVPVEFRDMTLVYNSNILEAWYPKVGYNGGNSRHGNQAVQLFSLDNPQYSHVWEVTLDVRYTGNWYDLLSKTMDWARRQPRKLQWERAEKFYIPSYHGSYANFSASLVKDNPRGGVWGPMLNEAIRTILGPQPETLTPLEDDFFWGVDEDADDIVPNVLVNTKDTPLFENDELKGFSPRTARRALMVSPMKCLSKRLLRAMHEAQIAGLDMRPELLSHSLALAHGLKVAAAPLPIYFDNDTSTYDVNSMFNDPTKKFMLDSNEKTLAFKADTTYWWPLKHEQFAKTLYRRWYGVNWEGKQVDEGQTGRLCLPAMLLHPVSDVTPYSFSSPGSKGAASGA